MNSTTVKIAVLLLGGYLLYRYYEGTTAAPPDPNATPAPPAPAPPAAPAPDMTTTRALLARWAATVDKFTSGPTAGTLNAFEWLWGYNHVRGTNVQDTGYPDGSVQVTLDEFLAHAQTANIGLQGVAAVWGF
jgi:hypothetical protein